MDKIISPVVKELLVAELTKDKLLRLTNNKSNEIYIITAENSPNVMQEIGRLREVTFRDAGGGTGKSIDIDEFDLGDNGFKQMIVWDPEEQQIVGGYRYIDCGKLPVVNGVVASPTSRLFSYSHKFIEEYLPHTIELGRSFVQPFYQPTYNLKRGLFALNNLWDGIGALIVEHANTKYLFGKVTMYPQFDRLARDLILYFMQKYFPDKEKLIFPKKPLIIDTDSKTLENYFKGSNYDENYKTLVKNVRKLGENVPPLVSAYMSLSSTMRTFGTSLNDHFGDVEETGILVTIKDIYHQKKDKHVNSYVKPKFD
ncbi:MAG: GNAT family N-acetyltransferase [Bacteroidales bacterium]|nr:GNAT family N-acetyltransferase [Bacteroidales bacterium]